MKKILAKKNKSFASTCFSLCATGCIGLITFAQTAVYASPAGYGQIRPYAEVQSTAQNQTNSKLAREDKKNNAVSKKNNNVRSNKASSSRQSISNRRSHQGNSAKTSVPTMRIPSATVDSPVSDGYISYDAVSQKRREAYVEAKDLARSGDEKGVRTYKEGILKDYALNVYLDYYLLQSNVAPENFSAALSFVRKDEDHELSIMISDLYADKMGALGKYAFVLEIMGRDPHQGSMPDELNVKQKARQCRWYEASLMQNKAGEAAVSFATALYVSAKPYPEACSGLIGAWSAKGYMTNASKARRFQNLLIKRNVGDNELKTAAHELEGDEGMAAVKAAELRSEPERYADLDDRRARVLSFERFASLNPQDAARQLDLFENECRPTSTEKHEILRIIAAGRLGNQSDESDLIWVDENLPAALWTEGLIEKRLRRAIWFRQWKYIVPLIEAMGDTGRNGINWQYWKGRALINTGKKQEGLELLRKVAHDRSFFGFAAAQLMGMHPYYGNSSLKRSDKLPDTLGDVAAVKRFFELYAMNDPARFIEWREIALNTDDETALFLAEWALRTGEHQLAISAVTTGMRWDALDYRFPQSYLNLYKSHAVSSGVSLAYLYGISRQESMLNPVVRSPVGAVGLMQLMPATAKTVAKKNGWRYQGSGALTDPDTNIRYGAAYLNELLGKFKDNRVLASAGYNAGPGRVARWKSKDGMKRDAFMYIENIPFNETRTYVQRVLFYTAVYEKLLSGRNIPLLSESERNFSY